MWDVFHVSMHHFKTGTGDSWGELVSEMKLRGSHKDSHEHLS